MMDYCAIVSREICIPCQRAAGVVDHFSAVYSAGILDWTIRSTNAPAESCRAVQADAHRFVPVLPIYPLDGSDWIAFGDNRWTTRTDYPLARACLWQLCSGNLALPVNNGALRNCCSTGLSCRRVCYFNSRDRVLR